MLRGASLITRSADNLSPNPQTMKNTQITVRSLRSLPTSFLPGLGKMLALTSIMALAEMSRTTAAVITPEQIIIGPGEVLSTNLPGGAAGLVLETGTLIITWTGQLNLQDNALIVRTGNFATINGYLVTGYNLGAWNGYGINSSVAAADVAHLTGVGIIDNSEAHLPSFEGHSTLLNTEFLIKFALYGDANLDGFVNELDVALFGSGSGVGWYHGDFNYSGTVDAADYALLNAALPPGGPSLPEPSSLCLALAGAGIAGSRRARRA